MKEKFKKSDAFKKAEKFLDEAEDYIDNKVDEFEQSGMKEKLKAYAESMEDKAEEFLEKAGVKGKELADRANKLIDKYKEKVKDRDNPKDDTEGELNA